MNLHFIFERLHSVFVILQSVF